MLYDLYFNKTFGAFHNNSKKEQLTKDQNV